MRFCEHCGAEVGESQKFCGACGASLTSGMAEREASEPDTSKRRIPNPPVDTGAPPRSDLSALPLFAKIAMAAGISILLVIIIGSLFSSPPDQSGSSGAPPPSRADVPSGGAAPSASAPSSDGAADRKPSGPPTVPGTIVVMGAEVCPTLETVHLFDNALANLTANILSLPLNQMVQHSGPGYETGRQLEAGYAAGCITVPIDSRIDLLSTIENPDNQTAPGVFGPLYRVQIEGGRAGFMPFLPEIYSQPGPQSQPAQTAPLAGPAQPLTSASGPPYNPPPESAQSEAQQSAPPEATPATAAMQPFTSAAGHFSVVFPATPQQSSQPLRQTTGEMTTVYKFSADDGNANYTVEYIDYTLASVGASPRAFLQGSENSALAGKTPLTDAVIGFGAIPGRAFTFADADGFSYSIHEFLAGTRFYRLIVITRKGYTATQADQFMNSFKLVGQ